MGQKKNKKQACQDHFRKARINHSKNKIKLAFSTHQHLCLILYFVFPRIWCKDTVIHSCTQHRKFVCVLLLYASFCGQS
eukprot:UN01142